jgi:hypothetical protein
VSIFLIGIVWIVVAGYSIPHYKEIVAINNMDEYDESDYIHTAVHDNGKKAMALGYFTEDILEIQPFDEYQYDLIADEKNVIMKYVIIGMGVSLIFILFSLFNDIILSMFGTIKNNLFNECSHYF